MASRQLESQYIHEQKGNPVFRLYIKAKIHRNRVVSALRMLIKLAENISITIKKKIPFDKKRKQHKFYKLLTKSAEIFVHQQLK